MRSRQVVLYGVLAVLAMTTESVTATVINVDFENNPSSSSSVTYSGQGAMAATGDIWNSVHPTVAPGVYFWGEQAEEASFSASSLLDSAGNVTGVGVSASAPSGIYTWTDYGAAAANDWSQAKSLMNDWLMNASDTTYATVTVSGLMANGEYDLVLYGHSHEGGGNTVFTVGGVTQTTTTTTNVGTHALTSGYDYVTFSNMVADTSGNIAISYHDAVGGNSGGFNGFQMSGSVPELPEPNTVVMIITGLFGLLAYAWRKRR